MKNSHIHPKSEGILILDYGSQYTLLIARRLRELGVYAEIIDGLSGESPSSFKAHGIVLSGGPDSVTDSDARQLPSWVLESGLPVLGICYGMQLLVQNFDGTLQSGQRREYGQATLMLTPDLEPPCGRMFYGLPTKTTVWMSHGDDMATEPKGFDVIGRTEDGVPAVMTHRERPIIGLQFHPEVQHSTHGAQILKQFAFELCRAPRNWDTSSMLEAIKDAVKKTAEDGNIVIGVSGGVDSTVATVLLSEALGRDKVTGVFVDNGLLRKNEVELVSNTLRELGINLHVLHKADVFLSKLKDVSDPETKRKIVGVTFIDAFQEFAEGKGFSHLGQGTLYPDVIESAGHGSGSKVIKSHHNVGGLPDKLHLELLEPFRYLFKDEVRRIGEELGLPTEVIHRHPFPGPGLSIRIPGEVTGDKVAILQEADDIFIKALHEDGFYSEVWQAGAVLLPVKSVGVMGDNRTYQWTCSLRAVSATDGMTANASELPMSFLTKVADQIVRKVDGINRVLYDITGKPPATIEWE